MSHELIIASNNEHKISEIKQIFATKAITVFSLKDKGIDIDVVEDKMTFSGNAKKKAVEIQQHSGGIVIADDSGIEIDFLNKAPGIYSARFAGYNTPYTIKNQLILDIFKEIPPELRSARYVCSICLVLEDGSSFIFEDTFEGNIHNQAIGENGFGYDPIFFVPEYNKTAAQLEPALKNSISHRAKALKKMQAFIETQLLS